jgi:hypothetical protein
MEALGFLCVAGIVALVVALLIGAVILRSACYLAGAPVPEFGKAMGVVFVTGLLLSLANFGVQVVLGAALGQGAGQGEEKLIAQLISSAVVIPIDFLLAAGLYTSMLEGVSFGKGLLIYLIQFLIGVAIAIVVVGVIILAGVGGGALMR